MPEGNGRLFLLFLFHLYIWAFLFCCTKYTQFNCFFFLNKIKNKQYACNKKFFDLYKFIWNTYKFIAPVKPTVKVRKKTKVG